MTPSQKDWLEQHPRYEPVGKPRPGVKFSDCGTLYTDGRFDSLRPMKVVRLEQGCFAVGVRQ